MKQEQVKKQIAKPRKKATQYSIDLDLKGIIVLLGMSILTAGVVFYLGVIYGKASRDPGKVTEQMQRPQTTVVKEEVIPETLEIYDIKDEAEEIDSLKQESKDIMEEVDRMLGEPGKQSGAERKAVEKPSKPVQAESKKAEKTWPDTVTEQDSSRDLYTVQVFATKDQNKADRIVRTLKNRGFDAYHVLAVIENQKIYRIRVGRKSKDEVEPFKRELEKVVGGMGMSPRIIKIN